MGRTWTSLREVEKFGTPHPVLTGPIVFYVNGKVMATASTPITKSLILDINNFEAAHVRMYFGRKWISSRGFDKFGSPHPLWIRLIVF